QGPVEARALDVEDLAADRQDRLRPRVPPAHGRAARGVALDDEDLALLGAVRLAVAQLARHAAGLEQPLAAGGLARLARRDARLGRLDRLADDVAALVRVRVEPVGELLVDDALDERLRLGVAELGLRLALELRLAELDGHDGGEALADVVAREVVVLVLEDALVARVAVDEGRHRGAEALLVRAALRRGDRVRVGVDGLGVRGRPLHRDLDRDALLGVLGLEVDDVRVDELDLLRRVEVLDVVDEAAVVLVRDRARRRRRPGRGGAVRGRDAVGRRVLAAGDLVAGVEVGRALVGQGDAQALVEERHLLEARAQRLEVELGGLEDLRVGPERLRRPGGVGRLAALELADGLAAVRELLAPRVAVALDLGDDAGRERVDDGDADAVETAGDGVAAAAELAPRVEDRHDDLDRRAALGGVDGDRDAAPVVDDADAAVGEERHVDRVGVPGERLVHRVVHNLV